MAFSLVGPTAVVEVHTDSVPQSFELASTCREARRCRSWSTTWLDRPWLRWWMVSG